eukprot:gene7531-8370_t
MASNHWINFVKKTKDIFRSHGVKSLFVQELDQHEDGPNIQGALKSLTGKATVPHVFIDGKFIGGGDETALLDKSGKLQDILSAYTSNDQ